MNCKPGDLAVVVADDFAENIGGFVLVLRVADARDYFPGPTPDDAVEWECEILTPMRGWDDAFSVAETAVGDLMSFGDSNLRPVRDAKQAAHAVPGAQRVPSPAVTA